ncbi:MAG: AAA family ATPase [Ktedonobacteraceae bacterium]
MLHTYAIKNFLSFRDRTEVSFKLTPKANTQGWDTTSPSGQRLATAMAVIGPNGAGKTSLLKPLAFVSWFITNSFRTMAPAAELPIKPHFSSSADPIEVELEADDEEGAIWMYVLRAMPNRVLHEAVYKKDKRKYASYSYVFVRDWDEGSQQYLIKQQGFDFNPTEAKKVRPNASLISTAAQYGVEVAKRLASANVATNISVKGRLPPEPFTASASKFFYEDNTLRAQMEGLLRSWDLGLSGLEIRKVDLPLPDNLKVSGGASSASTFNPFGVHELKDGTRHELPMADESEGTRAAFVKLWRCLTVLNTGGVAVIDELESAMHPHMLKPLLDLFSSSRTNPHTAQIIFTCHLTEVLNLLGKSQVMLTEKTDCVSEAWRLDSMTGVRTQDNLYAKYMAGAYGAVPNL